VDLLLCRLGRLHIFVLLMRNNPEKPTKPKKTNQILKKTKTKIQKPTNT
jgi:hypothetical protein